MSSMILWLQHDRSRMVLHDISGFQCRCKVSIYVVLINLDVFFLTNIIAYIVATNKINENLISNCTFTGKYINNILV